MPSGLVIDIVPGNWVTCVPSFPLVCVCLLFSLVLFACSFVWGQAYVFSFLHLPIKIVIY